MGDEYSPLLGIGEIYFSVKHEKTRFQHEITVDSAQKWAYKLRQRTSKSMESLIMAVIVLIAALLFGQTLLRTVKDIFTKAVPQKVNVSLSMKA